jgi:hypothetical protein
MILSDHDVEVIAAWKGAGKGIELTVRTVGGIAGDLAFVDEESRTLADSRAYLVFLQVDDWVGQDILESDIYSPVGRTQGVFEYLDGRWVNEAGVSFTTKELERAVK